VTPPRRMRLLEAASVMLFFIQALRVAFSVLFGVIYDRVFEGPMDAWLFLSVLLLLLALAAPLLAPSSPGRRWLAVLASLAALARLPMTIDNPGLRYWSALVIIAAGGLYLAGLLTSRRSVVLPALLASLMFDQVLRALGDTFDLGLQVGWLPAQLLWTSLVVGVAITLNRRMSGGDKRSGALDLWAGLGLGGLLFIETSLLSLPNAVARWSQTQYAILAPALLLITAIPLNWRVRRWLMAPLPSWRGMRRLAAGLLAAGLLIGYAASGVVASLALLMAHAAALVCLVFIVDGLPSRPQLAGGPLGLGLIALLILNFFNAFAFAYPYTLPWMRGLGWVVYLVAAASVWMGVSRMGPAGIAMSDALVWPGGLLPFTLFALALVIWMIRPQNTIPPANNGLLRLATYNIHYGYDDAWHATLGDIAQTLKAEDVDVVALQEVDTGRMTSYAADDAYFLARRLGMNVAYLPTVEHLTGIAVLYCGPAESLGGIYLASRQEQTGMLHIRLAQAGGMHAFGIWMGLENEDTQRQIQQALAAIGNATPAMFGGDFNSESGSSVAQAVQAAGFVDAFTSLAITPIPPTDPAIHPQKRIDFVWLRGLTPVNAWVPDSLASDHRMVVVEVATP
jgi:endonuclease/exonuclease/phosphatase family metal-dependent hydrolase